LAAIPGFAEPQARTIQGDALDYPVRWNDNADMSKLVGKEIRLKFYMTRARIHAMALATKIEIWGLSTARISTINPATRLRSSTDRALVTGVAKYVRYAKQSRIRRVDGTQVCAVRVRPCPKLTKHPLMIRGGDLPVEKGSFVAVPINRLRIRYQCGICLRFSTPRLEPPTFAGRKGRS